MKANTIWALITGLAVGFLVGREYADRRGGASDSPRPVAAGPAGTVPADWLTEKDLNAVDQFAGLTSAQRYNVLKVMNEKPCDCGCPHGSIAKCKKEDPACPRAPVVLTTAIAEAKAGKSAEQILAAVKKPDSPGAQQPQAPAGPQKIEVAAWTPIKGPKYAKVTIVEYSDFQ